MNIMYMIPQSSPSAEGLQSCDDSIDVDILLTLSMCNTVCFTIRRPPPPSNGKCPLYDDHAVQQVCTFASTYTCFSPAPSARPALPRSVPAMPRLTRYADAVGMDQTTTKKHKMEAPADHNRSVLICAFSIWLAKYNAGLKIATRAAISPVVYIPTARTAKPLVQVWREEA